MNNAPIAVGGVILAGLLAVVITLSLPDSGSAAAEKELDRAAELARRHAYYYSQDLADLEPVLTAAQQQTQSELSELLEKHSRVAEGVSVADVEDARTRLSRQVADNKRRLSEAQEQFEEVARGAPDDPEVQLTLGMVRYARALGDYYAALRQRSENAVGRADASALITNLVTGLLRLRAVQGSSPEAAVEELNRSLAEARIKLDESANALQQVQALLDARKQRETQLQQERLDLQTRIDELESQRRVASTRQEALDLIEQARQARTRMNEIEIELDRLRVGSRVVEENNELVLAPIERVPDPRTGELLPRVAGTLNEPGIDELEQFQLPLAESQREGWQNTVTQLSSFISDLESQRGTIAQQARTINEQVNRLAEQLIALIDRMEQSARVAEEREEAALQRLERSASAFAAASSAIEKQSSEAGQLARERSRGRLVPRLQFVLSDRTGQHIAQIGRGDAEHLAGLVLVRRVTASQDRLDMLQRLSEFRDQFEAVLTGPAQQTIAQLLGPRVTDLNQTIRQSSERAKEHLNAALAAYREAYDIQQTPGNRDQGDMLAQARQNTLWSTQALVAQVRYLLSRIDEPFAQGHRNLAIAQLQQATEGKQESVLLRPSVRMLELLGTPVEGAAMPEGAGDELPLEEPTDEASENLDGGTDDSMDGSAETGEAGQIEDATQSGDATQTDETAAEETPTTE